LASKTAIEKGIENALKLKLLNIGCKKNNKIKEKEVNTGINIKV
jgi:hypothetical protein